MRPAIDFVVTAVIFTAILTAMIFQACVPDPYLQSSLNCITYAKSQPVPQTEQRALADKCRAGLQDGGAHE